MKRSISVFLSFVVFLPIFILHPLTADASNGIWIKEYYRDKFGDPTEKYYITNENRFEGSFNSESIEDGELEASIVADIDGVYIVLYEEGKRVKSPGKYNIDIKITSGEVYSFIGFLNESNQIVLEDPDSTIILIDALSSSDIVSFYIEHEETQNNYVFKVKSDNFDRIYEQEIDGPVKEPIYREGIQFLKDNDNESAYLAFSSLGSYKDSKEKSELIIDELGGPSGLFLIGAEYCLGENGREINYNKGVEWLQKSAELGNSASMWFLGYMYDMGNGLEQDYQKAIEWYEKAADLGEADAMFKLGRIYYLGLGVEKNYSEAYKWLSKAADLEHKDAYLLLGVMNEYGHGTTKDYEKAIEYYMKAAELGDAEAMQGLGHIYIQDESEFYNPEKSFFWYKRAAENGLDRAMEAVGIMYEAGIGTDKDYNESFNWYSKAAEAGNSAAIERIQYLVDHNYIDADLAAKWIN